MTYPNQPASGISAGRQLANSKDKAAALLSLQQQAAASQQQPQPYNWAQDPIWDEPIPEPPDWDDLSADQPHLYKLAAIAYAVRAVADTRGVSAARLMTDWEVL